MLESKDIVISMSRVGNPWDNAYAETFMKTLKSEEGDGRQYRTMEEAQQSIDGFISESTTTGNDWIRHWATSRRPSSSKPNRNDGQQGARCAARSLLPHTVSQ